MTATQTIINEQQFNKTFDTPHCNTIGGTDIKMVSIREDYLKNFILRFMENYETTSDKDMKAMFIKQMNAITDDIEDNMKGKTFDTTTAIKHVQTKLAAIAYRRELIDFADSLVEETEEEVVIETKPTFLHDLGHGPKTEQQKQYENKAAEDSIIHSVNSKPESVGTTIDKAIANAK
jgi:hypothetical protein